jgi:predicted RNase H-like HicB family nuclease
MISVADFTVCYTRTASGYMGQLLEWPEVISEGADIDECRAMVEDAAREMMAVCEEDGLPIPVGRTIFETMVIGGSHVGQPA